MLTVKQPVHYGYKSVHDLPTPPSACRPSPPLVYQEPGHKPLPALPRGVSPPSQPMSAPHRPLPLPAVMTLAQPPPVAGPPQPPPPPGPPLGQAPPTAQHNPALGQLPAPPPWQGGEEAMRTWLVAKAEEEKRRQEEEKTRQETLRLEQRRTEHDILRTSLQGGIPPAMVPVVFAGMAGTMLSQAAVDWAQQYMYSQTQQQQQQHPQQPAALLPPGHVSPEHQRRDSQAQPYGPYSGSTGGVPSTPGSAHASTSGYMPTYPASPTRPRGLSMPGAPAVRTTGGGSNLSSLNTNLPPGQGPPSSISSHPGIATAQQQQQQEAQPSPSIYFHHWQPPTSHASRGGSSDQPGTPSVGESPRKRKATGPQPAAPPPSGPQRLRSPPFSRSAGLSNPPPGRRRGHARQRSDISTYRSGGRRGHDTFPNIGRLSPSRDNGFEAAEARQGPPAGEGQAQPQLPPRSGAHPVSSLLSDNPPSPHYTTARAEGQTPQGEGEQRSPSEQPRGAPHSGTAATRERDSD